MAQPRNSHAMKIEVFSDAAEVALAAARYLASVSRDAVAAQGRFVVALSGGNTPWLMLNALAKEEVPWTATHLLQVDERVVPAGNPNRNLTHLRQILLERTPLRPEQIHDMPVDYRDLEAAAEQYAKTVAEFAGIPPQIDLVHLGLGADGHTASLVPGDRVLDKTDTDVAITNVYQGARRMTLTYPILNRARRILWLVTGKEKANALALLQAGDLSIPAGRVRPDRAVIFADRNAADGGR
jgi:6-phosphogluconolactonase